jgi:phospholipase/carboxylesterase
MVPLEPEQTPDLKGAPILLSSGRFDPIVPVSNTERLAALLQGAGADVTLRWENGGHGLANGELADAKAWLSQVLEKTNQRTLVAKDQPEVYP